MYLVEPAPPSLGCACWHVAAVGLRRYDYLRQSMTTSYTSKAPYFTCSGGAADGDNGARAELSHSIAQLVNWLRQAVELNCPQVEGVLDRTDLNLVVDQANLLFFSVEIEHHAVVCGHRWAVNCTIVAERHSSSQCQSRRPPWPPLAQVTVGI